MIALLTLLKSRAARRRENTRIAPQAPAQTSATDTEFTAEIVRITRILPHPNADRLEIARFEMKSGGESAYEVVVGKGDFAPGDLAAYFSVDCIVPTAHRDFAFLTKRLDGAGKTHYRLKAARLRGVFSQGLLVAVPADRDLGCALVGEPCHDAKYMAYLGDHIAGVYGVTYHRDPEPQSTGPTAPSSKKGPQPFPIYTVDSLKKMPRLFDEGEPVIVTEKIHGTNFRFGWVRRRFLGISLGWKFVVGSHRVMKGDGSKGYYGDDLWLEAAEKMRLAERTKNYKGYTFYGELYGYTYSGKAIQDLTYGRGPQDGPGLMCFDVRGPDGEWLGFWQRTNVLVDCEIDPVPLIGLFPYGPVGVPLLAEGNSTIAPKQIREGVVIESDLPGIRKKAKYVGQGYLLRKGA